MEKVRDVLAIIFYLIWIPLGLLLVGTVITIFIMNPLQIMEDMFTNSMEEMDRFGSGPEGFDQFGPRGIDEYDLRKDMPSRDVMNEGGPPVEYEEYIPQTR